MNLPTAPLTVGPSADHSFRSSLDENTIPVLARSFGTWQLSLRRKAMDAGELTRNYDRAAAGWSRTLDRLGFPVAYERLLRRLAREEAICDGDRKRRVLDCGVGTGAFSSALARVSQSPFELDAIDISPLMLEQAGRALRAYGIAPTLRQGDVRSLPYEDGTFDLVMSAHVLEHLADPHVALDEMLRVLKPGGLLVACLTLRSSLGMLIQLKWRTHRMAPADTVRWLRASGLDDVRFLQFNGGAACRRLSIAYVGRKPASPNR